MFSARQDAPSPVDRYACPDAAETAQSAIPESKTILGSWPAGPPDTEDSHKKAGFDQLKIDNRARCSINWF
ncbi:uncharacterized protein PgNI_09127 [Pyricularia grisea]|uniref:Uncharacterized protein n=1 Tax=Pyricularia grisea TaxID=148305 RepID=A0A6P8AT20_PYRGI|nr:uncharacterized protein PgNI_09127 [Pyricularia grisea]TLD05265.1 hypothetical protein PgNI_09127 [Pyricularia grisea]